MTEFGTKAYSSSLTATAYRTTSVSGSKILPDENSKLDVAKPCQPRDRLKQESRKGVFLARSSSFFFFNDLVKRNPTPFESITALFADDVAIWVASRSLKIIQLRLQKQLNQIEEWKSTSRTKLSVTKTVYTVFIKTGRKTHLNLVFNALKPHPKKIVKIGKMNSGPRGLYEKTCI